jgi:hypothetical protein
MLHSRRISTLEFRYKENLMGSHKWDGKEINKHTLYTL